MLIGILGLVVFALFFNVGFYEYRVIKGIHKEPKYITTSYNNYQLIKRYK